VYGLVVSTAVWVIDWVHCDTTDAGVEFASRLGAVVSGTGLHQRLLSAAVASQYTNGCTAFSREILEVATWQTNTDPVTHSSF
tara:strand:+ start:589 stop:837 length:249 start_codon:yes stop_codon:yes gene_type:complete